MALGTSYSLRVKNAVTDSLCPNKPGPGTGCHATFTWNSEASAWFASTTLPRTMTMTSDNFLEATSANTAGTYHVQRTIEGPRLGHQTVPTRVHEAIPSSYACPSRLPVFEERSEKQRRIRKNLFIGLAFTCTGSGSFTKGRRRHRSWVTRLALEWEKPAKVKGGPSSRRTGMPSSAAVAVTTTTNDAPTAGSRFWCLPPWFQLEAYRAWDTPKLSIGAEDC
jgi:hypothetical protein